MLEILPLALPSSMSPTSIVWCIFAVVCILWAIATAILLFHWRAYGTKTPRLKRMKRIYLIGSGILLASALSFIFSL